MSPTAEPPRTEWTRDAIEAFLAREKPAYQRIELPFGLATSGRDRSKVLDFVLPPDLRGKTVLDVGSFLGFFCIEAARRGARGVVGIEVNERRMAQARTIADILGVPVEYRKVDIEASELGGPYDHVLCLNVLHHLWDPIAALDRLVRATRETLVLEVAGTESPLAKKFLKSLGAGWWVRRALRGLPIVVVGRNGFVDREHEQKYFFTPAAVHQVLGSHRREFARIDERPSPFKHRAILTCRRWRIGKALLVAGPPGSGKTYLSRRITAGDPCCRPWLPEPSAGAPWTTLSADSLPSSADPVVPRLLFLYDPLRPWGTVTGAFDADEGLDPIASAEEVHVAALAAPRHVLAERLRERMSEIPRAEVEQAKAVLALYERPEELRGVLSGWLSHCAGRGWGVTHVDVSAEPRAVEASTWWGLLA